MVLTVLNAAETMIPPKSVDELEAAIGAGFDPKFVFFWGHQPSSDGRVTKACFSQWWMAPFTADGIEYRTAEHFMMASKARLFGDAVTLERILAAPHPKQAKDLGRSVADFDEAVWLAHRFEYVVAGNRAKFSQHSELADFLLGTGQRVLVEASPVDRIWGIGLSADSPDASRPDRWRGLNLLGFALMEVRYKLSRGVQ
jgi:ribA/ribD-fused uncharacterized protein